MASHSLPRPTNPPLLSLFNLIKHALSQTPSILSKFQPQIHQTNSQNQVQILTRIIHAVSPNRIRSDDAALPLYIVNEFLIHPTPIRSTTFADKNLSLMFQSVIGFIAASQTPPSPFLQIAQVMMVITFGVSICGVFLRNSFSRFGNNLDRFCSVLTSVIFFIMENSFLPARFCFVSWPVFALLMAAFLLSLFR